MNANGVIGSELWPVFMEEEKSVYVFIADVWILWHDYVNTVAIHNLVHYATKPAPVWYWPV